MLFLCQRYLRYCVIIVSLGIAGILMADYSIRDTMGNRIAPNLVGRASAVLLAKAGHWRTIISARRISFPHWRI